MSKISTNKKAIITSKKSLILLESIAPIPLSPNAAPRVSSGIDGMPTMSPTPGKAAVAAPHPAPPARKSLYGSYAPTAQPQTVAPAIPMIIAPLVPLAIITAIEINASIEIIAPCSHRATVAVSADAVNVAKSQLRTVSTHGTAGPESSPFMTVPPQLSV